MRGMNTGSQMRVAIALVSALATGGLSINPAVAEDDKASVLTRALFSHMAAAYMCRLALGGVAHYQAARTIAVNGLTPLVGGDQAVLYVDEMDRKFKADPRAKSPEVTDSWCLETLNEGMHQISVAQARLRQ